MGNVSEQIELLLEMSMASIDIPPRPIIIDKITKVMQGPNPDLYLAAEIISQDVGLAASLIKTTNASFLGRRYVVRSVHEAINSLGLKASCNAITSICLRNAFPGGGSYERFWDTSYRIAALSAWLARDLHNPNLTPEDAYTFALFRDTGIIILMRRFPAYIKTLAVANEEEQRSFTDVERDDNYPTDHSVMGAMMAQEWWLPPEIILAIQNHHDLGALSYFESGLGMSERLLIAVAQTAECLLQRGTGSCKTCEWEKLGPACLRLLRLNDNDLYQLQGPAEAFLSVI